MSMDDMPENRQEARQILIKWLEEECERMENLDPDVTPVRVVEIANAFFAISVFRKELLEWARALKI